MSDDLDPVARLKAVAMDLGMPSTTTIDTAVIRAVLERLETAEAAQALLVERAVEAVEEAFPGKLYVSNANKAVARIRALAPASGVAALAALRADVKGWADNATEALRLCREAEAEVSDLRTRLAAAEAQVGALREALDNLMDAITTGDRLGDRSLTIQGSTAALKWLIEAQDDARAALASAAVGVKS